MRSAIYQRLQGKHYAYLIRYDHAGYEIRRNGTIKKVGRVPQSLFSHFSSDEAAGEGLFTAELDIESLIGMEE